MLKARIFCRRALQEERLLFNVPKIPLKTENKSSATSEPRNKVNHQATSPYSSKLEVTYGKILGNAKGIQACGLQAYMNKLKKTKKMKRIPNAE